MFFLRCAFFLSIVYASMSWTNGALPSQGFGTRVIETGRAVTAHVMTKVVAGATDLCTRHAAECMTDAARLTALFAAGDPTRAVPPTTGAPVPRRHGRDAKLARAL